MIAIILYFGIMKAIFHLLPLLFFVLFLPNANSQVNSNPQKIKKMWFSNHVGIVATSSIHQFDFEETRTVLNQVLPDRFNGQYLNSFGISIITPYFSNEGRGDKLDRERALDTHLDIQVFGPFGKSLQDYKLAFTGVSFGYDMGKDLFPSTDWFDLIPALGFNTGLMKVKYFDDAQNLETSVYKNPFFSPKVLLEARFKINKFAIGFRAEYNYDISKSYWKVKKGNNILNLPENRARGLVFTVIIGELSTIEYKP